MEFKKLDTPAAGTWARDCELLCLVDFKKFKISYLRDEDNTYWQLECKGIVAYKVTNEEFSRNGYLFKLPIGDAFYELLDSPWLLELGQQHGEILEKCRHYVLRFYDETIEIVASGFLFEQLEDKPIVNCEFVF